MIARSLQRILVIRRDNIGDLVCTTPLLRALRRQLPDATIDVLATRYNQAVLENSPDIDALYFYVKAKHREAGESVLGLYWQRLCLLWQLRRKRYDVVLIAGGSSASALRLARSVKPGRIMWLDETAGDVGPHEVEKCCHLLRQVGLAYETPPPRVVADPATRDALRNRLGVPAGVPVVGIHISARKPSQRWPAERFAQLMRAIHAADPTTHFLLLWAPGSESNALHPGDDEKAKAILSHADDLPLHPVPTHALDALIAALSLCDTVVCADGGAMHLAAGVGKPIVCLFGQSDASRWHPWGVDHELLQPPSLTVEDLPVDTVLSAFQRLASRRATPSGN